MACGNCSKDVLGHAWALGRGLCDSTTAHSLLLRENRTLFSVIPADGLSPVFLPLPETFF